MHLQPSVWRVDGRAERVKMTVMRGAFVIAALLLPGGANADDILTAKNGMTLYVYDNDRAGTPTCYKNCAKRWPPYLGGTSDAMTKDWTLVKRRDGGMQWAYHGRPLYFY